MPNSKNELAEFVTSSGNVFDMIDSTIEEHAEWLKNWYRSIICLAPLEKVLLDVDVPIHEFIERVDDAVIAAKRAGRNRSMMWSTELTD
jgi:hypothetical protein